MYPRDQNRDYQFQGRIRVQLKEEDGKLCNENFPTRKWICLFDHPEAECKSDLFLF